MAVVYRMKNSQRKIYFTVFIANRLHFTGIVLDDSYVHTRMVYTVYLLVIDATGINRVVIQLTRRAIR